MANTTSPLRLREDIKVIWSEHERLGLTLRRLRDLCRALESERPAPGTDDPVALIAALHADLVRHFAAEEADTYFGAIVSERPSVLHDITDLKAEHVAMLRALVDLGVIASDDRRWNELSAPALRLIARLRAHERRENALMQEFLLRDEGSSSG